MDSNASNSCDLVSFTDHVEKTLLWISGSLFSVNFRKMTLKFGEGMKTSREDMSQGNIIRSYIILPRLLTGKKCNIYILVQDFPLIPRFRIFRINSVFYNVPYIPCFGIFHIFRILEYSMHSAILLFHYSIPLNRVTPK